jgi:uncharacterized protein YkwD
MKIPVLLCLLLISLGSSTYRGDRSAEEICLHAEEKKLYDLIMEYRKSKGLEAIPLSGKLTKVAQLHARDLADNYTFDPSQNKCNPHSWSKKGNWTSCCYTNDHKEAACMWRKPQEIADYPGYGYEIAYYSSLGANAQEGLDGWKISAGHNPLIINSDNWSNVKWSAIGIGIYKEYGLVWFGEVADPSLPITCP